MSYHSRYQGSASGDSRRSSGSRRESPPRHRSRRSPSPGPSGPGRRERSPKPRDPKTLPESFGRVADSARPDDDLSVLQRMTDSYRDSPLHCLYTYVSGIVKVKVYTRNHKDVRGVVTGYIVCFDKHWNLIMKDCNDVFHKAKKCKTPFLRNISSSENLPDIPARVPKKKGEEEVTIKKEVVDEPSKTEGKKGKKKKNIKKVKTTIEKKEMTKLFVRGDNIVMVCPVAESSEMQIEEEEEEEEEEGEDRSQA